MSGDPLRHQDISRDKACEFFEKLFYGYLGMPSSYDVEAGGDYSRAQAIDKEVLPAKQDSAFKTYYEEQMDILDRMAAGEEAPAEQPAQKQDDDVIDVEPGADGKYAAVGDGSSTRAVGAAASTAVGMPKKIWYGVDVHIPAGGGMLGMGGSGRLGQRGRRTRGYLREEGKEAVNEDFYKDKAVGFDGMQEIAAALREIAAAIRQHTELSEEDKKAILDECDAVKAECEKCGDPECKDGEICGLKEEDVDEMMEQALDEATLTPQDQEDIADMFASYGGYGAGDGTRDEKIARFMQTHAAELKDLVRQYSSAGQLGDYALARDLGNDDMNEDDLLKGRKHNAHVDEENIEDIGEDEDTLDEALVRRSNWLAKEIW